MVKSADNTTVVVLISGGHETAYRDEVQWLTVWHQEKGNGHPTTIHPSGLCGEGVRLLCPWSSHHRRPDLGCKCSRAGEEDPANTLFPENPQEEQHLSKTAFVLLSMLYCEHPALSSLCVVLQLLSSTEENTSRENYHGPEDHWMFAVFSSRAAQLPLSQESLLTPSSHCVPTSAIRLEGQEH